VMSDVTTRRGRVQGSSTNEHGEQVIEALVPAAEITRYAIDLRSMTGGRGQFAAQHHHYDVLPPHLVEKAKQTLPKQH
jgi:elongation factor G